MKPNNKKDSVKDWLNHIKEVMKGLRTMRGYTRQEDAADGAGISRGSISGIENAKGYNMRSLLKLLEFYDAHPSVLFGSTVPLRYKNKTHERLHEQTQELLEAPGHWPTTTAVNIQSLHDKYRAEERLKPKDKK